MPSPSPVLLVHGLLAHRAMMWPLSRRLAARGFRTESFGYTSWRTSIEVLAHGLNRMLATREEGIHVVTHSMGGIILRAAQVLEPRTLGRVVMLAPPNEGSHVASMLGPALRHFVPSLDQLADREDSFVSKLPAEPPFECAIIAAARDHVVREASTHLSNEADHRVVPAGHGTLPFRRDVANDVVSFLSNGRFPTESEFVHRASSRARWAANGGPVGP